MSSQKSPKKGGALAKSTKSPVKALPSPIKSPVRSRLSLSLSPSWTFNGVVELAPASSNGSDPEYHANPDEISLGSSEDAEQAGPVSDPQLLIEEIHDYNGPVLHPDATSSPSNASKRVRNAGPAAANTTTTTTHKGETMLSASSRVKKGEGSSSGVKKNVVDKKKSKAKTTEKQREATGTQRNTRSRRGQAEFGFDELDALLKRRRQERKKGS